MFDWFKKEGKPLLRIYCIGDVAIPQMKDPFNSWVGLTKKGLLWQSMENQIAHCGLPTAEEAEKFLRTINIIYPKGL